ncbi:MAG: hypothetical protein IKB34_09720 [Clostridia bacterium]|nr:hypothetical protein [Clostridia bacterium]
MRAPMVFCVVEYYTDKFGFSTLRGENSEKRIEHGYVSVMSTEIHLSVCDSESGGMPRSVLKMTTSDAPIMLVESELSLTGEYKVTLYRNADDRMEICSFRSVYIEASRELHKSMVRFICDNDYRRLGHGVYALKEYARNTHSRFSENAYIRNRRKER